MSSHASLDAAAQERKARLAKLKSLKRKAPDTTPDEPPSPNGTTQTLPDTSQLSLDSKSPPPPASTPYLSGRNYDATTRSAKLGFEHNPSASADTAEKRAAELAESARAQAEKEAEEERAEEAARQLDLFRLRPKKANWDLRRDVERRMERLNVLTENAIARSVRERVEGQRRKVGEVERGKDGKNGDGGADGGGSANGTGVGIGEGGEVGLKGEELVSALHAKERQEEEEERREREEDEEEEEGFK